MAWLEAASLRKRRKLNHVRIGSTDLNTIHVQRWLQHISIEEPSQLLMLLMLLMTHIWYSHLLVDMIHAYNAMRQWKTGLAGYNTCIWIKPWPELTYKCALSFPVQPKIYLETENGTFFTSLSAMVPHICGSFLRPRPVAFLSLVRRKGPLDAADRIWDTHSTIHN